MMERYGRHALIDWFSQEQVSALKVVVVGAGAVGNEVVKNLALLGVGEVHICDLDKIEIHNLTKSVLFRELDIGRYKSIVAAEAAMAIDPNIRCVSYVGDFWDTITIEMASSFDIAFCCVDSFEARVKLNTLCFLAETDFVNVGIDSRFASIEMMPFSASQTLGCYECGLPDTVYQRISERYSCGHLRKAAFIEKKVPTTAITSSIGAAFAVSGGLRLGSKSDVPPSAIRLLVDTISGITSRAELARKPDCPCCGRIPLGYKLIQCRPLVGELLSAAPSVTHIEFSDPILVEYRVPAAGLSKIVFGRASSYDDTLPATLHVDPAEVEFDIRDQFDLGDLSSRFGSFRVPSKFAIMHGEGWTVIAEFTGEVDG
jgi:molybdopterin-synthase adenylyltransferase